MSYLSSLGNGLITGVFIPNIYSNPITDYSEDEQVWYKKGALASSIMLFILSGACTVTMLSPIVIGFGMVGLFNGFMNYCHANNDFMDFKDFHTGKILSLEQISSEYQLVEDKSESPEESLEQCNNADHIKELGDYPEQYANYF